MNVSWRVGGRYGVLALLPNLAIRTGTDTYPVYTRTLGMLICIGGVFHICTVGLHPMAPVPFFGCTIMS